MFRGAIRMAARRACEHVGERVSGETHRGAERWYATRRPVGRKSKGTETSVAVPKWTSVRDPKTGSTYWWNKVTNETTAIGLPKPTGSSIATSNNQVTQSNQINPYDTSGRPSVGLQLGQMVVFGFGGALGVTFISVVIAAINGGATMEGKEGIQGSDSSRNRAEQTMEHRAFSHTQLASTLAGK